MPIIKPKITAPPPPSSRPESASRAQSATPSAVFPPALSQDTRLKRPLASRSTGGPRTAEGRARSSLNAIKHGGYVTASSAAQEYQATFSELVSRINPVGVVEEGVVNSLAVELFRLSMLGKLELERVQSAVHAEVSTLELAQALEYPWTKTHPDELRNPPELKALRARVGSYLATQLGSLLSQCGTMPSAPEARTIEALRLAVDDMQISLDDDANDSGAGDAHKDDGHHHEPAYIDELDRHMRELARGNELLSNGMALPSDTQPLVDYWLLRNYHRIEATRRDLQVAKLVEVLTSEGVRRARGHAMRQLDDCVRLLELLRGGPVDFGSAWRARLKD